MSIRSLLKLNKGFKIPLGSLKANSVHVSQNFIKSHLKICLISQISNTQSKSNTRSRPGPSRSHSQNSSQKKEKNQSSSGQGSGRRSHSGKASSFEKHGKGSDDPIKMANKFNGLEDGMDFS